MCGRQRVKQGWNGRVDGLRRVARWQSGKFEGVLGNINLGFQRKVRTEDHNTSDCKGIMDWEE